MMGSGAEVDPGAFVAALDLARRLTLSNDHRGSSRRLADGTGDAIREKR